MEYKDDLYLFQAKKGEKIVSLKQFDDEAQSDMNFQDFQVDILIQEIFQADQSKNTELLYEKINTFLHYLSTTHPKQVTNLFESEFIDFLVLNGLKYTNLDLVSSILLCIYYIIDYIEGCTEIFIEKQYYHAINDFILDVPTRVTNFALWIYSALINFNKEIMNELILCLNHEKLIRLIQPQADEVGFIKLIVSKQRPYICKTFANLILYLCEDAVSDELLDMICFTITLLINHSNEIFTAFKGIYLNFKNNQINMELFQNIDIDKAIELILPETPSDDLLMLFSGLIPFVQQNPEFLKPKLDLIMRITDSGVSEDVASVGMKIIWIIVDNDFELFLQNDGINFLFQNTENFNSYQLKYSFKIIFKILANMDQCLPEFISAESFELLSKVSEFENYSQQVFMAYEMIYTKSLNNRDKFIQYAADYDLQSWLIEIQDDLSDEFNERINNFIKNVFGE